MTIDLLREDAVSLTDARKNLIPKFTGKPVSAPTIYRWVAKGLRVRDGSRVKLEAIRIGREFITTKQAVHRFLGELTARAGGDRKADVEAMNAETEHRLRAKGLL